MRNLFLKSLAALILVCSLAAPAYAQPGDRDGFGEVERKDMSAGTLTIDGQVYRVTARTRLRDLEGHITTLAAIDAPQQGEKDVREMLAAFYTAVESSDGLLLTSLEMLHEPPQ